jgi:hypothetical protein
MPKRTLFLLLSTMASLCVAASDAPPKTYAGVYFYNFENAYFTPDGNKDCWVVGTALRPAEINPRSSPHPSGTARVVVRRVLGPKGHFGNLGICTRVLKIVEIVSVTEQEAR